MPHSDLALLKAHLNLEHDLDDALLDHKLAVADHWCASFLGTGTAPDVVMTEARLQLAAYWYGQREAASFGVSVQTVPFGVHDLLRPYAEAVTGYCPPPAAEADADADAAPEEVAV